MDVFILILKAKWLYFSSEAQLIALMYFILLKRMIQSFTNKAFKVQL